ILTMLTDGKDLEDISFEIDEVQDCKECFGPNGVCQLWVMLAFVEDMKPQMNIEDSKATIDNLDEQIEKIALRLIRALKSTNSDNN
ncbi:MAG: hypothetical protein ACO1G1_00420, partial [Bacteroidota bacterium]